MTSPKSLSQTGVLGKMCIYETIKTQIEFHLLQWREDRLKFIWYFFQDLRLQNDRWHIVQVHSPEKSKNQDIVGKLPSFPHGILESNETCRIGKRTRQATARKNFRLREAKIS